MANVTVDTPGRISVGARISIRDSNNFVYVIVTDPNTDVVRMKKGNIAGVPTSFSTIASLTGLTDLVQRGGAIAIDSNDIIHCIFYQVQDMGSFEAVRYVQFDTSTDTFGTVETAQALSNKSGFPVGDMIWKACIAIDANDDPHIGFRDSQNAMGADFFTNYYSNRIGGTWSPKIELVGSATDLTTIEDIIIADPLSSTNADRPILVVNEGLGAIHAFFGNLLNATSMTVNADITGAIVPDEHGVGAGGQVSLAIDSNEKLTVGFCSSGNDLYIVEHLNANAWSSWETPIVVDSARTESDATIAINENFRYLMTENVTLNDIHFYKDELSGWVEQTGGDLPIGGAPTRGSKLRYSTKNYINPRENDYVWQDGNLIFFNSFQGAAQPVAGAAVPFPQTHNTGLMI